jgi:hypothetical protein
MRKANLVLIAAAAIAAFLFAAWDADDARPSEPRDFATSSAG